MIAPSPVPAPVVAPARASSRIHPMAIVVAALLTIALLTGQVLIGGTRLIFAFPGYGLLALAGVLGLFVSTRGKPAPDAFCLTSAVLFLGYILLRAFFSPAPDLARSDLFSVAAALVVYFLTATSLADSRVRMFIVTGLLLGALAHVGVGAIQFRYGDNWMPIQFLQRFDYGHRASGYYICPNHLAGLLEVLALFGLSLSFWSRWPVWAKLLLGYAALMCYVGLMLTGSRGGYVSALVSLLLFIALSLRLAHAAGATLQVRIGAAVVVVGLVVSILAYLVIQHSDYLSDRARNVVDNHNIRLDFWRAATAQWKMSPVLGTGSRTYLYYGRMFRSDSMQLDPVYVHNDYLQLLAEYGLVGAAAFLVFFLFHWRRGWITARRIGPRRIALTHRLSSNAMALNLGALCALAAMAVHSIFDFNLHIPANALLLAFVFGILANSGVEQNPEHAPPGRWQTLPWMTLCALLGVALGIQIWRIAPGELFAERARASLRDGRYLAAMSFARTGLTYEHTNPQLFYYLGRARFLAGETMAKGTARNSFYEAALPAYEMARDLAPLDESYWLELAFTYDKLGRHEEAEWMYSEAKRLDPKSEKVARYYQAHLEQWQNGQKSAPPEPLHPNLSDS